MRIKSKTLSILILVFLIIYHFLQWGDLTVIMSITINNKVTSTSSIDTWKILMSNSSKLRLEKPHQTQWWQWYALFVGIVFLIQHWTRIVLGGSKDSQRPENRLGWIVLLPSSWGTRIGFKDWLKDGKILLTGKATKQYGTKQFHYWEELSPIALNHTWTQQEQS